MAAFDLLCGRAKAQAPQEPRLEQLTLNRVQPESAIDPVLAAGLTPRLGTDSTGAGTANPRSPLSGLGFLDGGVQPVLPCCRGLSLSARGSSSASIASATAVPTEAASATATVWSFAPEVAATFFALRRCLLARLRSARASRSCCTSSSSRTPEHSEAARQHQ